MCNYSLCAAEALLLRKEVVYLFTTGSMSFSEVIHSSETLEKTKKNPAGFPKHIRLLRPLLPCVTPTGCSNFSVPLLAFPTLMA